MSVRKFGRSGFTLVELLVSMAIIAILAALLIPAVQSARMSALRLKCKAQLHQLSLALHSYHEEYSCFPPGSYVMGPSFATQSGWGWGAMILPHVEQGPLFDRIDFREGTAVSNNLYIIANPLSLWRCPSEIAPDRISCSTIGGFPYQLAVGNYCGSEGVLRSMSNTKIAEILDGTSHTFLLGERMVQTGENGGLPFTSAWCGQVAFVTEYDYRSVPHLWPNPFHPINDSPTNPSCFGSRHVGGTNFALADGSVRFFNAGLDAAVYEALGTPDGNEVFDMPQ